MNGEAGKGDNYRKVDLQKYETNYERIFGKRRLKNNSQLSKELKEIREIYDNRNNRQYC